MPTISTFYGLTIRMYYDDHPPPHFHVYYADQSAIIAIDTLEVQEGNLTRRAIALILEWAQEHRDALRLNWALAESHEPLQRILPLP